MRSKRGRHRWLKRMERMRQRECGVEADGVIVVDDDPVEVPVFRVRRTEELIGAPDVVLISSDSEDSEGRKPEAEPSEQCRIPFRIRTTAELTGESSNLPSSAESTVPFRIRTPMELMNLSNLTTRLPESAPGRPPEDLNVQIISSDVEGTHDEPSSTSNIPSLLEIDCTRLNPSQATSQRSYFYSEAPWSHTKPEPNRFRPPSKKSQNRSHRENDLIQQYREICAKLQKLNRFKKVLHTENATCSMDGVPINDHVTLKKHKALLCSQQRKLTRQLKQERKRKAHDRRHQRPRKQFAPPKDEPCPVTSTIEQRVSQTVVADLPLPVDELFSKAPGPSGEPQLSFSGESSGTVSSTLPSDDPKTSTVEVKIVDRNVEPPKLPWTALSNTSWDALYR